MHAVEFMFDTVQWRIIDSRCRGRTGEPSARVTDAKRYGGGGFVRVKTRRQTPRAQSTGSVGFPPPCFGHSGVTVAIPFIRVRSSDDVTANHTYT